MEFSCVVVDSFLLSFFVNGIAASNQSVIDKGFIQLGTEDIDPTTRRTNLTATALTQYNNTEIQCVAFDIGNAKQQLLSDIGILLVQGPLSSFGNISNDFTDSSSLNISWNPPFTLPGTYITGYNISVTSIMFNISQFNTDTYYVLTAPNNTDPCDEISITVSGYNGAGNREMTTISSLYFPKVPSVNSSIPVTIEQNVTGGMVEITVLVNVSELCPGEYPTTIDILNTDSTDDTTFTDIMLMEGSQDNILTAVDTITLQSNMIYTIQVSFSNLDGEFNISSNDTFTTYDVQSFDITSTSGEVCGTFIFATNTIAVGVQIEILQNGAVLFTVMLNRTLALNFIIGCIPINIPGYYDLYIYDVENDTTVSDSPAIIMNDVFVDVQTTTTGIMIPTSSVSNALSPSIPSTSITITATPTEGTTDEPTHSILIVYISVPVCGGSGILLVIIIIISVLLYKKRNSKGSILLILRRKERLHSTQSGTVDICYVSSGSTDESNLVSKETTTPQQKPNPIYADLAVTKRKNRPIPPAPEDNIVVYTKLMEKEQADIIRQQLEQKPPPYEDVQISTTYTSVHASVTVIPPGIHSDRDVTSFKVEGTHVSIKHERPNVEETFENQYPGIPTPEDNQNDIPPPVPARVFSQNSPRRTPPIPPPTTPPPPPPPPSHLSSSSQVSQSGNIPDIIRYSQDELEKGYTEEELVKTGYTVPAPGQLPGSTERISDTQDFSHNIPTGTYL